MFDDRDLPDEDDSEDFRNTNLAGADLYCGNFSHTDYSDSDFSGSDLAWANFSSSILDGCSFQNADMSHASLTGASLRNADLRGVNFTDVVFDGAVLYGAITDQGVVSDSYTRYHPGPFLDWDPEVSNIILTTDGRYYCLYVEQHRHVEINPPVPTVPKHRVRGRLRWVEAPADPPDRPADPVAADDDADEWIQL